MSPRDLPDLNAALNFTAAALLVIGRLAIRRGRRGLHQRLMLGALAVSVLFLGSYVIYHYQVGSVPYPYRDWTRVVYLAVLIPHILGAGILIPLALAVLVLALGGRFATHRKLARWVWPWWLFVSLSGIVVYLMLYQL